MTQVPILFLGDSPSLQTGLSRIGRDLAVLASRLPQFRVAYLGRGNGAHIGGGIADSRLPFMQYTYQPTSDDQWGTRVLPDVWRNWARGERGVIFTIWDPSRLTWFGNPQPVTSAEHIALYEFLTSGQFGRWGYFAIDAEGPGENGALAPILASALRGYDRVLAYSKFGMRVIDASFDSLDDPHPDVDWLPHGINTRVFTPRDRGEARARFRLPQGVPLVGCVMSNQPRKDWGLWARTMQLVAREIPSLTLWAHTDSLTRHWDLRVLLETFELESRTLITLDQASDEEMSWRYSACDVTVLPSLGEGFGYPIVESLACNVPVVHGTYGAGAEWINEKTWLIEPTGIAMDTRYCMMRPVYDPSLWAHKLIYVLGVLPASSWIPTPPPDVFKQTVEHLDWKQLWPRRWSKWFTDGAKRFEAGR
jgi:glycosyltransferase involved in cell wall biosynthesis